MALLTLPGRPDAELVVVIDCTDPTIVGEFWADALGYRYVPGRDPYNAVVPPEGRPGIEILLQRVPEAKAGKNRLHLDLRVPDLDAELRRLTRIGARVITESPVEENRVVWHVLADPEGNEFCVLRMPSP